MSDSNNQLQAFYRNLAGVVLCQRESLLLTLATMLFYLHHLQRIAEGRGIHRLPGEPVAYSGQRLKQATGQEQAMDELTALVNQAFYRQRAVDVEPIRQAALAVARSLSGVGMGTA